MPLVSSGVEHGNLRELALARMRDLGTQCRDVRTREVGIQEIHNKVKPYEAELIRRDYVANGGWETFLSYEDPEQDILIGLLRLRKCSEETYRAELKGGCSIVRELHVYGTAVPVHARDPTKFQHQVINKQAPNFECVLIKINEELKVISTYRNYSIFRALGCY